MNDEKCKAMSQSMQSSTNVVFVLKESRSHGELISLGSVIFRSKKERDRISMRDCNRLPRRAQGTTASRKSHLESKP